jgi:hypothetical protein
MPRFSVDLWGTHFAVVTARGVRSDGLQRLFVLIVTVCAVPFTAVTRGWNPVGDAKSNQVLASSNSSFCRHKKGTIRVINTNALH